MKIRTSHDYPPIPYRDFDWSAVEDNYEPGDPIGRGRTEALAIADLKEQLVELCEDEGCPNFGTPHVCRSTR